MTTVEKKRIDAMTMQRFLPIVGAIVLGALGSPAFAIECSRAVSTIEKTICADDGLRKADDQFNRGYTQLLDLLDRRQRQELIESQRAWLKERDSACAARPSTGVAACVSDATRKRKTELAKSYSDGYVFGKVKLPAPGASVVVGTERLEVLRAHGDDTVPMSLVHGNTLIAESQAPFEIDGRGGDERGEAVVISTGDYGSLGCSEQYLISVRPGEPLRAEPLSNGVDFCSRYYRVKRKADGLELTMEARPGVDGDVKIWSSRFGTTISDHRVEFAPKPGTRMADFVGIHRRDSGGSVDGEAPTDNEEFFNALRRAAPLAWRPMAQALSWAFVRSEDGDKYLVLSPCERSRSCPVESAFAAYAKSAGTFYFAYELPASKYKQPPEKEILYYPAHDKWPNDLSSIVEQWVEGDMRDDP